MSEDKFIIRLIRGHRGDRIFSEQNYTRANCRALSLADLHNTGITERRREFIVDATEHYDSRKNNGTCACTKCLPNLFKTNRGTKP